MFKRILGIVFFTVMMIGVLMPATQAQAARIVCPFAWTTHLKVGDYARVKPGIPNILRTRPYIGYDSAEITELPAGVTFSVIGGPSCYNSMILWQVNYNGQIGWLPEAADWGYWIEPFSPDNNCMLSDSHLSIGMVGQVLPNRPNAVRSQPNQSSTSTRYVNMQPGDVFTILGGPNCSNGMTWWQVNYNGYIGWTPENQGYDYALAPYGVVTPAPVVSACSTTRQPPVVIGYTGIVAPGVPNNLRAQASMSSQILASMSAGETFTVLSSPACADGLLWWQVNYRGKVGWTVEGQNGQTWINLLACPGFQASRISVGKYARVTPGLPNRLRSTPSTSSASLALIPAGASLNVIGGAVCAESTTWWQVNYQGMIGWTMEGQGNQYWLELAS